MIEKMRLLRFHNTQQNLFEQFVKEFLQEYLHQLCQLHLQKQFYLKALFLPLKIHLY